MKTVIGEVLPTQPIVYAMSPKDSLADDVTLELRPGWHRCFNVDDAADFFLSEFAPKGEMTFGEFINNVVLPRGVRII